MHLSANPKSLVSPALVLALLLALLAGCVSVNTRPTAAQQQAVEHATSLQDEGRYRDAAQAWEQLAHDYHLWRYRYALHAAENYRQLGNWQRADPLLAQIQRGRLDPKQATHLDLLLAQSALRKQDVDSALRLTKGAKDMPAQWRLRAMGIRARALLADRQFLPSARMRLAMNDSLSGFDRAQNQQRLVQTLEQMSTLGLQNVAKQLADDDPLRPWIGKALEAQGASMPMGEPQLRHQVGTLLPAPGPSDVVSAEGYAAPHSVALLLPASGPLQQAGAAVKDGFATAWQHNAEQTRQMQLLNLDTGGTVAGATSAYRQAVASGADLVVGPLAPDAVQALFQHDSLPVPILALNHPERGVPPAGSTEFSLPPEAQGAQVASRMRWRGLDEALLFVADASWAKRAAGAFKARFTNQGGHIAGVATLSTSRVDYAQAIATLLQSAGPDTGIFIAMRPRQGRLLVPQLRIAEVEQPLFATSHIYGAIVDRGLNRDLDGVIFCGDPWLFDAQPGLPRQSKLAEDDPQARGPSARLFAFGMDAFALMPYLDWMHEHPGSYLAGATGKLTIDDFGRVRRTPIWVTFVNGIAQPVTGALNLNEMDDAGPAPVQQDAPDKLNEPATQQH